MVRSPIHTEFGSKNIDSLKKDNRKITTQTCVVSTSDCLRNIVGFGHSRKSEDGKYADPDHFHTVASLMPKRDQS